jgi:hypothetical protein
LQAQLQSYKDQHDADAAYYTPSLSFSGDAVVVGSGASQSQSVLSSSSAQSIVVPQSSLHASQTHTGACVTEIPATASSGPINALECDGESSEQGQYLLHELTDNKTVLEAVLGQLQYIQEEHAKLQMQIASGVDTPSLESPKLLLAQVEELQVSLQGKTRRIQQLEAAVSSAPPSRELNYYHQALYDFSPEVSSQLGFQAGDVLEVVSKETQDVGWWQGKNDVGQEALVPSNYLQLGCEGAVEIKSADSEESYDLLLPSGCVVKGDNSIAYPDGSVRMSNGSIQLSDGSEMEVSISAAGVVGADRSPLPDGCVLLDNGCFQFPSGAASTLEGKLIALDGVVSESPWELPPPLPSLAADNMTVEQVEASRKTLLQLVNVELSQVDTENSNVETDHFKLELEHLASLESDLMLKQIALDQLLSQLKQAQQYRSAEVAGAKALLLAMAEQELARLNAEEVLDAKEQAHLAASLEAQEQLVTNDHVAFFLHIVLAQASAIYV